MTPRLHPIFTWVLLILMVMVGYHRHLVGGLREASEASSRVILEETSARRLARLNRWSPPTPCEIVKVRIGIVDLVDDQPTREQLLGAGKRCADTSKAGLFDRAIRMDPRAWPADQVVDMQDAIPWRRPWTMAPDGTLIPPTDDEFPQLPPGTAEIPIHDGTP